MKKPAKHFEILHTIILISHSFASSFSIYLFPPKIPNTFDMELKLLTGETKLPACRRLLQVTHDG